MFAYPELPLPHPTWRRAHACSLKEYERQKWVLAGWGEVFVNSVHGQVSNLFLSMCQQLLMEAQVAAPGSLNSAGVSSVRSTVESAAPFAAVQRRGTLPSPNGSSSMAASGEEASTDACSRDGTVSAPPPPALLLLLCKLCSFAEQEAVGSALVLLQQLYPERLLSGGDELPAFLPSELGRQLAAAAAALLQGYTQAHGVALVAAVESSTQAMDWVNHKEPRAARPVCNAILDKVAGGCGRQRT